MLTRNGLSTFQISWVWQGSVVELLSWALNIWIRPSTVHQKPTFSRLWTAQGSSLTPPARSLEPQGRAEVTAWIYLVIESEAINPYNPSNHLESLQYQSNFQAKSKVPGNSNQSQKKGKWSFEQRLSSVDHQIPLDVLFINLNQPMDLSTNPGLMAKTDDSAVPWAVKLWKLLKTGSKHGRSEWARFGYEWWQLSCMLPGRASPEQSWNQECRCQEKTCVGTIVFRNFPRLTQDVWSLVPPELIPCLTKTVINYASVSGVLDTAPMCWGWMGVDVFRRKDKRHKQPCLIPASLCVEHGIGLHATVAPPGNPRLLLEKKQQIPTIEYQNCPKIFGLYIWIDLDSPKTNPVALLNKYEQNWTNHFYSLFVRLHLRNSDACPERSSAVQPACRRTHLSHHCGIGLALGCQAYLGYLGWCTSSGWTIINPHVQCPDLSLSRVVFIEIHTPKLQLFEEENCPSSSWHREA